MWRKYAEIFFKMMRDNFFVGIDDIIHDVKEREILANQVATFNAEKATGIPDRTIGVQLMFNIAEEIMRDINLKLSVIDQYASEKRDEFLVNEFENLSTAERHFLIMWIYHGYATSDSFRYFVNHRALRDYHLIKITA